MKKYILLLTFCLNSTAMEHQPNKKLPLIITSYPRQSDLTAHIKNIKNCLKNKGRTRHMKKFAWQTAKAMHVSPQSGALLLKNLLQLLAQESIIHNPGYNPYQETRNYEAITKKWLPTIQSITPTIISYGYCVERLSHYFYQIEMATYPEQRATNDHPKIRQHLQDLLPLPGKNNPELIHSVCSAFYVCTGQASLIPLATGSGVHTLRHIINIVSTLPATHGFKSLCLTLPIFNEHVKDLLKILCAAETARANNEIYPIEYSLVEHTIAQLCKLTLYSPQSCFEITKECASICNGIKVTPTTTIYNPQLEADNIRKLLERIPDTGLSYFKKICLQATGRAAAHALYIAQLLYGVTNLAWENNCCSHHPCHFLLEDTVRRLLVASCCSQHNAPVITQNMVHLFDTLLNTNEECIQIKDLS